MKLRLFAVIVAALGLLAGCHHKPFAEAAGPNWTPDPLHATLLTTEEMNGNGIEVGQPKVL